MERLGAFYEIFNVNGDRYRAVISDYLMSEIGARDLGNVWFEQDGATSHTSHQSMHLLRAHFGKKTISRLGPVDWTTQCDITPLDFFLRGYIKPEVYAENSGLGAKYPAIRQSSAEMLERVIKNSTQRMNHLRRNHGQYLKELTLKK